MKTKQELEQLKHDFELLKTKLSELSEDEIKEVVGGGVYDDMFKKQEGPGKYEHDIYFIKDRDDFKMK